MFMRNLSDLDADMTKMKGVLSLPNFKSLYEWSSAILGFQESHKLASELLSANQICDSLKQTSLCCQVTTWPYLKCGVDKL
ncbi:hypothetical protein LWI29_008919 [Acer saccharum]|uniref:Uncharacterized protein n=1 Tax=Acer saccharum TaxID=4024 RepID=A0AA39W2G4_ACESA|nr:hypothetical protein LWI29_008919 [Acer saccharum]